MHYFLGDMIPIVAIVTVFGVPATVIIVIAALSYRRKVHAIKNGFGPVSDLPGYPGRGSLLWGMLLTGVSAVGVVLALVNDEPEFLNFCILALATGLSLLGYWKVSSPHRERDLAFFERWFREVHLNGGTRK